MFKLASYVSTAMGIAVTVILGGWILVTLQINLYLFPQELGTGEIHPLYSFQEWVYYWILAMIVLLAGAFFGFGAILRHAPTTSSVELKRGTRL